MNVRKPQRPFFRRQLGCITVLSSPYSAQFIPPRLRCARAGTQLFSFERRNVNLGLAFRQRNLKIVDIPIRYHDRVYGETNIQRWRDGRILLKMVLFALGRIKFV